LSCRALCLRVDFLLAGFRRQPFRRHVVQTCAPSNR
jgi:hypothetical protein